MARYGDSFNMKCWQLRDNIKRLQKKLWQDWNHNMYGFGDGPQGEYIPVEKLEVSLERCEVAGKFLKDSRFSKFLMSSQPVAYLFRYVKGLIESKETELTRSTDGIQLSFFQSVERIQSLTEEQKKALKEEIEYLKAVRDMIKSPEAFFGYCYRVGTHQ